jgi:hypothetical protein
MDIFNIALNAIIAIGSVFGGWFFGKKQRQKENDHREIDNLSLIIDRQSSEIKYFRNELIELRKFYTKLQLDFNTYKKKHN